MKTGCGLSEEIADLLAYMLAMPVADHRAQVHEVLGGQKLCQGHVVGLYRISKQLDWKGRWKASSTKNKGVAFHIWLYHFSSEVRKPSCSRPLCRVQGADKAVLQSISLRLDSQRFDEFFRNEVKRQNYHGAEGIRQLQRNDIKASKIWGVFSSSSANCKIGPRAS